MMSKRFRSMAMVLTVLGLTAFLLQSLTTAQDKSDGAKKSSAGQATTSTVKSTALSESTKPGSGVKSKSSLEQKSKDGSTKSSQVDLAGSKAGSNTLRLPRYFSGIVDQEQRESIYAIQLEYRAKISELEEELARVRRDELSALEKLLTDSQRKLLAKKRSQAQESSRGAAKEDASTDSPTERS